MLTKYEGDSELSLAVLETVSAIQESRALPDLGRLFLPFPMKMTQVLWKLWSGAGVSIYLGSFILGCCMSQVFSGF